MCVFVSPFAILYIKTHIKQYKMDALADASSHLARCEFWIKLGFARGGLQVPTVNVESLPVK